MHHSSDKTLISQMIAFNPYFRSSAKECLDLLGGSEINKINFKKIKLDIDKDDAFDYCSGESQMFSEKDYIAIVIAEIEDSR